MIKRFQAEARLTKTLKGNDDVVVVMVPDDNGPYVLHHDLENLLEDIGAGAVSGKRITQKSVADHKKDFEEWCIDQVEDWGIKRENAFKAWHLGYYHQKVWRAWEAWKAARGVTE